MLRLPRLIVMICLCCGVFIDARYGRAAEFECVGEFEAAAPLLTEPDSSAILKSMTRQRQCSSLQIKGQIEKGDYERFLAFYAPHYRTVERLFLHSRGGDADEAMKLGRLARKYLIAVEAPIGVPGVADTQLLSAPAGDLCDGPQCFCASACALIWFGSVDRYGSVGLHRPKIADPQFAKLSLAQAKVSYDQALRRIVRYAEEMEIPRPLIDAMVATGTDQVHWATDVQGLLHPPSFVEWVNAKCPSPKSWLPLLHCEPALVRDLVRAERQSLSAP